MKAILVLSNHNVQNLRVMVDLTEENLKEQVISLLEQDRGREAFDILKCNAEVVAYLPTGRKPHARAEVTLFEDML